MSRIVFFLLLMITGTILSQNKTGNYYIKWEGVSKEGHIIYGVSYTKEEAQFVIDDFNERNAKTKYKIAYQTIKKRTTNNKDIVRSFYDLYPNKYRVLRQLDIAAMHIFKVSSFEKAEHFLKQNTLDKELRAGKYLHQLLKDYQLYRLKERKI